MPWVDLNTDTGEIRDKKIDTLKDKKRRKYFAEKSRLKSIFKEYNESLGGFIFAVYEMGKEFNRYEVC